MRQSSDPLQVTAALLLGVGVLLVMTRVVIPGLLLCVVGASIYATRRRRTDVRTPVPGGRPAGPQDRPGSAMPVLRGVATDEPASASHLAGLPAHPHVVLPRGAPVPVRGVAAHADRLAAIAPPGTDVWVALTLTVGDDGLLAARLDGERVGHLGPESTEDLLPLVRHVSARGLLPVAAATVRGSTLSTEVVLHCVRAQDVDDAWLRGLPGTPGRSP